MAFVPNQNNNTTKEAHKNNKYLNTYKVKISSNNNKIKELPLKCDEIEKKKSIHIKRKKKENIIRKNTNDMSATEFMINVKLYKIFFQVLKKDEYEKIFNDEDNLTDTYNYNNQNTEQINNYNEIERDKYVSEILNNVDDTQGNTFVQATLLNTEYTDEERLKDKLEFANDDNEDEIPILDDLLKSNSFISSKEADDRNKRLNELINKANNDFGREIVDDILKKYEIVKDGDDEDLNILYDYIKEKFENNKNKIGNFLEIFYNIIYLKYLKQIQIVNN